MSRQRDQLPDNGFEAWGGYMNAKKAKLEEQFLKEAEKKEEQLSSIFSGVSIYVNGFTIPTADELKTLMSRHGGVYHTYQRNEDFVIASNLPDTKVKNMSLARIVKPEWIINSIASNSLLDYKDYLLYKNSKYQPTLNVLKSLKSNKILNEASPSEVSKTSVLACVSSPNNLNTDKEQSNEMEKTISSLKLDMSTKTAADPNFISEFYNNSRLHHISQLGACFKQYVNDARESSNFSFPFRVCLKERISKLNQSGNSRHIDFEKGKIIMHIDMDCFFVSVGLRKRPHLRGLPVAVTHSKGGNPRPKRDGVDRSTEFNLYKQRQALKISRDTGQTDDIKFETRVDNITDEDDKYGSMSEIASCSYEARAKGITNGMFMGAALRLCPNIQTIPYDFEGYKEVAYTLYNTIAQYTLDIEAVSCDEMYVDCTELIKDMKVYVQDFASVLREEINNKTGCPCSTGFGGNRLQARLATKRAKPNGQFFLSADLVEDFMFNIKLSDLPGVGKQTTSKLEALGHSTCGSLQNLSLATLKVHLGIKTGAQLFDQCRGRDNNPLSYFSIRKSVSAEVNYGIRFENDNQCVEFLKQLSNEIHSRMIQFKVIGKCITLKLMVRAQDAPVETAKFMGHGFCDVINKSVLLNSLTNDADVISKEVIALCMKQKIDPKEMRGIGIQITKLESTAVKAQAGAISKFLSATNKKNQQKLNIVSEVNSNENELSGDKYCNISKDVSSNDILPKTFPTKGIKSPIKKRGRPPKTHTTISKNGMNRFLLGQNIFHNAQYKDPLQIKDPGIKSEPNLVKSKVPGRSHNLIGLPWEKIRELLRAWLDSGQAPLPLDVSLISNYMQEMVVNKNIDKLCILLNFLRRRTNERNDNNWKEVCEQIIRHTQNTMISVYGKKLMLND